MKLIYLKDQSEAFNSEMSIFKPKFNIVYEFDQPTFFSLLIIMIFVFITMPLTTF